jgi:hypothetical protein
MGWTVYNSDGKVLQSAEVGDSSVTSAKIANGAIVNADINASAAITYSRLATLADGNILVGNGSGVATSVNPSGDVDIANDGTFSIASGAVVNADVNSSAAVALTKLATTTVSRALVSDGSGVISPSAVTSTEIGYLDGVTSAIQTQIDAKAAVGSGTPSTQTIPDTAATGSSTEAARLDHVHTMPSAGGVPSGAILMWHGLIANIPSGWVLCNGANSTPDLRGQFIQGAANGVEAGATGGSATATPGAHSNHSVTQPSTHAALATHQHRGTAAQDGSGTSRRVSASNFGSGSAHAYKNRSSHNDYGGSYSSSVGNLTESIAAGTPNAHSGTAVDAHSAHSTSDSRPPFYTILYIMKS